MRASCDFSLRKGFRNNIDDLELIICRNSNNFECEIGIECMNILRRYYFFVAIVYEIISILDCVSRSPGIEFRMYLSKYLSELNYYRNLFGEYTMDKGRSAFLFETIHEFPKRKASFLNIQDLEKSSNKPTNIYKLSKIPQKLLVTKIYKSNLIARISHIVQLRKCIRAGKNDLLTLLEDLERKNEKPQSISFQKFFLNKFHRREPLQKAK
ncbi:hypothetical protein CmeUKMEL1_02910 [Cryptosporidium meleagridis]|uniref:Uncharacterized protein n=1 Tax=Cryptosporidium meleagridis TaxID=93969 RepID=A0A2P4YXK6_9CRYT|nr:hypothetical protein CmeUKMEL1_02910 [Cryptosporidium meleagridis]